jgi:hypothetical protein
VFGPLLEVLMRLYADTFVQETQLGVQVFGTVCVVLGLLRVLKKEEMNKKILETKKKNTCVSRESNSDQLLGRQLC